ncbi:MAG: gliding motility-associated C-terminal domain-containing protein [Saprospiraceae bacterium]|nr:gliding motility-associated C-terminal domain-containing protein [Saprospiraceae bacterium]
MMTGTLSIKIWPSVFMMLYAFGTLLGQTEYKMQNNLVHDCEGVLTHSEEGEDKNYDHNEDYTFTICIPGATFIYIDFGYFATERTYDVMTIYDGPDRNSPVLGTLSGILLPAPSFVARSGCVTIHFKSDDNITANGWRMNWRAEFELPPPPTIKIISNLECPLKDLVFELSFPVACDQLVPANFNVLGPGGAMVSEVTVLNCINGKATQFSLKFVPALDKPVSYRVSFVYQYIDECGKEHLLSSSLLFTLSNCPFSVDIYLKGDTVCQGACTELEAITTADFRQSFRYLWLPGGQTSNVIRVCDSVQTLYTVIATEIGTGLTDTAIFIYTPLQIPKILNPVRDTVCANTSNWMYQVDLVGGDFFSATIIPANRKTGIYEFWRRSGGNAITSDTVRYIAPNGCETSDVVFIFPIRAGADLKACVGDPPIRLSGGSPSGGFWSGSDLDPNGTFDPQVPGSYSFQYTAPNGCIASKKIDVFNNPKILNPVSDTVCASANNWQYLVDVPGGDFFSGIIPPNQRKTGLYEFWRMAGGDTLRVDTVTYVDPNGCKVRDTIFVLPVSAGAMQSVCQGSPPFNLTGASPSGGFWVGPYTDSTGRFNPIDTGTFTLVYQAFNGCQAEKTVRVNLIPSFLNPIQDTICASAPNWQYSTSITGGTFASSSIPPAQSRSGIYEFWRWSAGSGVHRDVVSYTAPNGCIVLDTVFIYPVYAGPTEAACQGSLSFQLNGGTPSGGFWSGPFVDSAGRFDPTLTGTYIINYQAPNGCISSKTVNVGDSISIAPMDTICHTQTIQLNASPRGGIWSGIGVIDSINGRVDATKAIANQWNRFVYKINGCQKTQDLFMTKPNAGADVHICLGQSKLSLPERGRWIGPGSYDYSKNEFLIDTLKEGKYNYILHFNSCRDTFALFVHDVQLDSQITNPFCFVDEEIDLNTILLPNLFPGSFTGNGVSLTDSVWTFNPQRAGPGKHTIVYESYGCPDSTELEVEIPISFMEYSFCDRSPPTILPISPTGGVWQGIGFLDENTGLFDPELSGLGRHKVSYITPAGCRADTIVEVIVFEQVEIQNVDLQYCFKNEDIPVTLAPPGGGFFINGVLSAPMFNPALLGTGNWELYYTKGTGACASFDRSYIRILAPITKRSSSVSDSICPGQRTTISIDAFGGSGGLTYTWDHGLGFGSSHIVDPLVSSWYVVTVTDQCSDPLIDSVYIKVYDPFVIDTMRGPDVCFGEETYVSINLDTAKYDIRWQTSPPAIGPRLSGKPGIYSVEITELATGCKQSTDIELPGAKPLSANFGITPNQPCIDIVDNTVEIIDLGVGYTSGTIDFGDGSAPVDLLSSGPIVHQYTDTGSFVITMRVMNDLGCEEVVQRIICVKNLVRVFIPTVFSPNGDGRQDFFEIFNVGVDILRWSVFDRFGARVFETNSGDDRWDGSFKGKQVVPGVYVVVIEYINSDNGKKEIFYGDITVIR